MQEIHFVVANDPWQKRGTRSITPAAVRLEMVRRACYWSRLPDIPMLASDIEIRSGGPSYTATTLRTLAETHPDVSFEVIVGSDAAAQLHTWHDAEWLADNATFAVVQRGGQQAQPSDGFTVTEVSCPQLEISSTDIRTRVASGASIRYLCPEPVRAFIIANGLYRAVTFGERP